jgi:neutral ceramidase
LGANINRSPSAYLNNPAEERANYKYDVDKEMSLLKFVDAELGPVGAFSWFSVHGTSMNRTNQLISGDNKGAAARFMEDWFGRLQKTNNNNNSKVSFGEASAAEMPGPSGGQPSSRLSSVMHKVRSKLNNSRSMGSLFVAAFCQSNVGDTTPNTLGPLCMDSGLPCDFHSSTCNGKSQQCVGRGPA